MNWLTFTVLVNSTERHWYNVPGKQGTLAAATTHLLPFEHGEVP